MVRKNTKVKPTKIEKGLLKKAMGGRATPGPA